MKINSLLSIALVATAVPVLAASKSAPAITGDYLEVRSCDVYTGPCFANAEMGLNGKEGMLVWAVRQGAWKGTSLAGLNVIVVVRTDGTLGDLRYQPRSGKAVLIVDARANSEQRTALADFAQTMAGNLVNEVVAVKTSEIDAKVGTCGKMGCATVTAGELVQISTRCLGGNDHLCGNEETFYPPLTPVKGAYPAFTEVAAFKGRGLDLTWQATGARSAFLGTFAR